MDLMELSFVILAVFITTVLIVFYFKSYKALTTTRPIPENKSTEPASAKTTEFAGVAESASVTSAEPAIPAASATSSTKESDPFQSSRSLKEAMHATENHLFSRMKGFWSSSSSAQQNLDQIEEVLYTSDIGVMTTQKLLQVLDQELSRREKSDFELVKQTLKNEFQTYFDQAGVTEPGEHYFSRLHTNSKPSVWMIVGVNGAGKTTSIGKLAAHLAQQGFRVLVAAGDTFRAAAGSQLKVWTERAKVEIFSPEGVTDPSAVAFDAVAKAKAQNFDIVLVDTAGRLHTQSNLMDELKKMKRVMSKVDGDAPHETLIVLDANNGQNALVQAKEFHQALGLTGVVLTKMDGTAKGGVAIGLAAELKIPIRLIGIGEKIGDLKPFSSQEYIQSIIG